MNTTSIKYGIVLASAGFFALIASVIPAVAAPPAQSGAKNANATSSPFASQIAALRAARTLLEGADHDYNGHRAAAVKLVSAAIHELHPPKTTTTSTAKKGTGSTAKGGTSTPHAQVPAGHMPQAQSDAMLKEAMVAIAAVQGQLANAGGAGAPAAANLQKAVAELQIAVTIK
jgi:hypothetical protein